MTGAWESLERRAFVNEGANEVIEIPARGHKRDLEGSMCRGAVIMTRVCASASNLSDTMERKRVADEKRSGDPRPTKMENEKTALEGECRHDRKSDSPRSGGRLSGDGSPAGEPPKVLYIRGRPPGDGSLAGEPGNLTPLQTSSKFLGSVVLEAST